jgi:hypothetical protein
MLIPFTLVYASDSFERDGMFFLADQVNEYDECRQKMELARPAAIVIYYRRKERYYLAQRTTWERTPVILGDTAEILTGLAPQQV